jgi:hypothetical protein
MTRFIRAERYTRSSADKRGRAIQGSRLQAAASQQFQDSSTRKEGHSKQVQGLKQFQDSADQTRKKTQGGIQGSQRPLQEGQIQAVHSDQAIEGGRIQLTILFYSIVFIV